MFHYFKRRELEVRREEVMSIAVGASAVVSNKALKKFIAELDANIGKLRPQRKSEMAQELSKLMGIVSGGI